MALDGAFIHCLKTEIAAVAIGARVDKIAQPSREEIIVHLRWRGAGGKLLISCASGGARTHFTAQSPENPAAPPMFCMLMRKHLGSAKLVDIRQGGLDRLLMFDFEAVNELGDHVILCLVVEMMGRNSNVILLGPDNRIIDSMRRVDLSMSAFRQILPGMTYVLPPAQDKLCLLSEPVNKIMLRLSTAREAELSKQLMENLEGTSQLLCREISHFVQRGADKNFSQLDDSERTRLEYYLAKLAEELAEGKFTPTMITELSGRPKDFTIVPCSQYGAAMLSKEFASCGELLDAFYAQRDGMERIKQRSGDLLRLLAGISDRITRKIAAQQEELITCAQRERLRMNGDIISANLYSLSKGDTVLVAADFYDPAGGEITISLDDRLTPAQNAQRYYAQYRKADTAEKMLTQQIVFGKNEIDYIDSVFDALTRAGTEAELDTIRAELAEGGYIKRTSLGNKRKKLAKLEPMRFVSDDGFVILAGRNNAQNDKLTLRDSNNNDLWFHTQKIPGSHTVIVTEGKDVPDTTLEQAAIIAAFNSRAQSSTKVPVDYARVRHVKKPQGAKPGMVIYDNFQTLAVDPDEALVKRLAVSRK